MTTSTLIILISLFILVIVVFLDRERASAYLRQILLSEKKGRYKIHKEKETAQTDIFRQIGSTLLDQWYVFFILAFVFYAVLFTAVGYDMLQSIIDDKAIIGWRLTYLSFFLVVFAFAIWALPFWILEDSDKKKQQSQFIVHTILITFISLIPYGIIAIGFLIHEEKFIDSQERNPLALFLLLGVVFMMIQKPLREGFLNFLKCIDRWISRQIPLFGRMKNYYLKMLLYTLGFHGLLILLALVVFKILPDGEQVTRYVLFSFLIISGLMSFLLFYNIPLLSRGGGRELLKLSGNKIHRTKAGKAQNYVEILQDKKETKDSYLAYFDERNKSQSKWFFIVLFIILAGANMMYYLSPSLTHFNTLFIILPLFGLNILILNFLRNLFKSSKPLLKISALIGMVLFLGLPFLSQPEQFNLNLKAIEGKNPDFDDILKSRLEYIDSQNNDAPIYIVCGQGGGSRAGYVMTGVLETLEAYNPNFLDQTLMYSTISGSSPGVYHYLKTNAEVDNPEKRREVYRGIYRENLNSGSVFGFFTGDNLDVITFGLLNKSRRSKIGFDNYYDRNERIKYEYDLALFRELDKAKNTPDYGKAAPERKSLRKEIAASFKKPGNMVKDSYLEFLTKEKPQPLHLVNTFEVNWGRRAVLTPGRVNSKTVFPNAVLPLEDENLIGNAGYMDLGYRDAVNLSELFPILSAAETINGTKNMQFVDGGYYENFGLTTALDVYNYIKEKHPEYAERIHIVLIKNSLQMPEESNKQLQLFAPLRGIMKAPFTGHSNYLDELARNELGKSRYKVITFDEKEYDISLTRGLTEKHILSLDRWIDGALRGEIEEEFKRK